MKGIHVNSIVDKKSIDEPNVNFSETALMQLKLIIENDFTLSGKYFRLLISGKGCDGFEYSVGFTDLHEDDFLIQVKCNVETQQHVVMDPFTAFYLQDTSVDYKIDIQNNTEGFVITNNKQNQYSGKFWKKKPEYVPAIKEELSAQ